MTGRKRGRGRGEMKRGEEKLLNGEHVERGRKGRGIEWEREERLKR